MLARMIAKLNPIIHQQNFITPLRAGIQVMEKHLRSGTAEKFVHFAAFLV